MMMMEKKDKLKTPIFKVNPTLDAYLDLPMFEDKIAAANEILRTVGLPTESMVAEAKKKAKSLITV
jgi:hypothetical protein